MFNTEEKEAIAHAIEKAERFTSGEIRVAIEKNCEGDVMEHAWRCFHQLKMNTTKLRNGVLIFVAYQSQKFAIIGDEGIHQKVAEDFWDETKTQILAHFKNQQFVQGIIAGVSQAGKQLQTYFPVKDDDINELPNEVVILD